MHTHTDHYCTVCINATTKSPALAGHVSSSRTRKTILHVRADKMTQTVKSRREFFATSSIALKQHGNNQVMSTIDYVENNTSARNGFFPMNTGHKNR